MCELLVLVLTLCSFLLGTTDCTSSFDQRQTGDLNVQIGLKNINIIALLKGGKEEYVDYDYAYDYSEMTIKPQNGTTPKPLNEANTTINIETQHNASTSTTSLPEQTTEALKNSTDVAMELTQLTLNQTMNNDVATTLQPVVVIPTTIIPESSNISNDAVSQIKNKCRRGFFQNNEGKCEYKVHGTSNALRRIVKLAQKIKIGRQYGGP
uniref:BPTI/Kunitz inhibitor domain-containing protein n=1 Tax=Heliothis virescens TaxID=7102 RepID=A0A2A4J7C6_HELVI